MGVDNRTGYGRVSPAMNEQEAQAAAVARALMPTWRERAIDAIDYVPSGYNNRNYRVVVDGRVHALRIARQPPPPGERDYLAIAAAPQVVAHDAERGHLMTLWIDGPTFADAPPAPAEAGAYLAALHRQIPTGVRDYDVLAEVNSLLGAAGGADPALAALVRELRWTPKIRTGCHNDLNPWNVVRGATGPRTLDWEMAGDNDPMFDVVNLGIGLGWLFADVEACRAAYQSAGGNAPADARHLRETATVFFLREHAWAAAQIATGNDRKEIRTQAKIMRQAAFIGAEEQ